MNIQSNIGTPSPFLSPKHTMDLLAAFIHGLCPQSSA